jgi:hypothetical protein
MEQASLDHVDLKKLFVSVRTPLREARRGPLFRR